MALAHYDRALVCFQKLERLAPAEPDTQLQIAECLQHLGREAEALTIFKTVADHYAAQGEILQAITVSKSILELDPNDRQTLQTIATSYRAKAKQRRALSHRSSPSPQTGIGSFGRRSAEVIELDEEMIPDRTAAADATTLPEEGPLHLEDLLFPDAPPIPTEKPLDDVTLFKKMSVDAIVDIAKLFCHMRVPAQTTIYREGDAGDEMFIVVNGAVRVNCRNELSQLTTVCELSRGYFFGAYGFFIDGRRHATVTSITETELLVLEPRALQEIVDKHPHVERIADRIFLLHVLQVLLARSRLFSLLAPAERRDVINLFIPRRVLEGEIVIQQGGSASSLFFIRSGLMSVTVRHGERIVELARLAAGDFFGEVSALLGTPRTATVTAVRPGIILEITRDQLLRIVSQNPNADRVLRETIQQRAEDTIRKLLAVDPAAAV